MLSQVPAAVAAAADAGDQQPLARWVTRPDGGMELQTGHAIRDLAWHARGDYFASVAPTGNTQVGVVWVCLCGFVYVECAIVPHGVCRHVSACVSMFSGAAQKLLLCHNTLYMVLSVKAPINCKRQRVVLWQ
jgi:hypothetical protein